MAAKLDDLAHRSPWALAGLALGVGVLVGSSASVGSAVRVLARVAGRIAVQYALASLSD